MPNKVIKQEETIFTECPTITLPHFDGDYLEWPEFSELFRSIILDRPGLSNVEKLYYLRTTLGPEPLHMVGNTMFSGNWLEPAWDLLTRRYDNKVCFTQLHLDRLFETRKTTPKSASSLTDLLNVITKTQNALKRAHPGGDLWDCVLVHCTTRCLDSETREKWEMSVADSEEYPKYSQLEEFLKTRARVLEVLEMYEPYSSSSQPAQVKRTPTAHHPLTQSSEATYPCDCCRQAHFVVFCPRFRAMSVSARYKFAKKRRLCFNCMGRHNIHVCRARSCKKCGEKHHTMIHGAPDLGSAQTSTQSTR